MAIVVSAKSKVISALLVTGLGTALTMLIGGMAGWFETDHGKVACDPPSLNGVATSQGCHRDADADAKPHHRHHKHMERLHHRHTSHNHRKIGLESSSSSIRLIIGAQRFRVALSHHQQSTHAAVSSVISALRLLMALAAQPLLIGNRPKQPGELLAPVKTMKIATWFPAYHSLVMNRENISYSSRPRPMNGGSPLIVDQLLCSESAEDKHGHKSEALIHKDRRIVRQGLSA
ncbi:hypothetical protein LSTR_LSTR002286 [Laodelphax striatellus]|uniref:Uncharacterized protein n=1 Tax=Laodelphax striatellus TaxID=195883 RepID=A0A482XFF0_LAOST|nr:hypothetical protein LSTR_LSTR002286 [Laodelphax striatellus]